MPKYKRILLKVSGEALAANGEKGICDKEVKKLAREIREVWQTGVEIAVVVGGGNFWRGRQNDTMDRATADYIGMLATVMNALSLGDALSALEIKNRVVSALAIDKVAETYFLPNVKRYLKEGYVVIFAAGTGSPYFSTDTTAALRACEIHADAIFCAKNIDGIYDSDPKVNPHAKLYGRLTYDKIIADNLKALDLTAVAMCREYGIKVLVFGKDEEKGLMRAVSGEKIGTLICAED